MPDAPFYPTPPAPESGGYRPTAPRSSPPEWSERPAHLRAGPFPTGCTPTSEHVLRAARKAVLAGAPPDNFAVVPERLDFWGNDQYGDCVTAEEAFAKACYQPEIFVSAEVVIEWARQHNVLNGATLDEVLGAFLSDGFRVGAQQYNDGRAGTVDYTSDAQLRLALSKGPVKIAIDSRALPGGAGNSQGWFKVGGRPQQFRNTDHCVSISGYGNAAYLYSQLGVQLPAALPSATMGFLLFTWSTIGFVDLAWIMSTCVEAWLREPTTVGVPPLAPPGPGPGPGPGPVGPNAIILEGTLDFFGQKLPVNLQGELMNQFGRVGSPNWWALLGDVAAVLAAWKSRDMTALIAAVQKLIADLGLTGSREEREEWVRVIQQALLY